MKTLQVLATYLNIHYEHPIDFELVHLSIDSRTIKPGDVFCAYQGAASDGHDYVEMAIAQGAVLILAERAVACTVPTLVVPDLHARLSALADWFYDSPSKHLKVIGVTGTNGKTSTTHYLAQFLHLLGFKVAITGTVGNGVWGALSESTHSTPSAISLQRQLADFVAQSVDYAIVEVSSHALEQQRVADIHFISAVFTNLTQDHLDFHKTMDAYAATKARLFAWPNLKTVILNKDDPQHLTMVKGVKLHTKVYYYSIAEHDDSLTYADDLTLDAQGLSFHLHSFAGKVLVKTQLLGSFNVSNLLAALTTLLSLNFSLSEMAKLSILVHPVKGRMEVLRYPNLPLTVIDYAHTPDGLDKALVTLKAYQKPVWVVFGCGGNRDAQKRAIMASIAENLADQVIITEDNSRKENPEVIFADIFKGFKKPEAVHLIPARADAITYALTHAPKDAIILLAGKGHETYLDTQGQKIHFDERDVVKKLAE